VRTSFASSSVRFCICKFEVPSSEKARDKTQGMRERVRAGRWCEGTGVKVNTKVKAKAKFKTNIKVKMKMKMKMGR